MCGIGVLIDRRSGAGQIDALLERMRPGISSRGPDGSGRLARDGVGLVHTRLAIIDLVTGDQPMWNASRTVACVFNGEIYNFRELRDELRSRGRQFATQSDTEVLLQLYEECGEGLVDRISGMFAFAIYDLERRRVVVARDSLGIKPLYCARVGSGLAFASTIRSLLDAGASSEPDPTGLAHYLRFYKVPEPRTAYRSVTTFPRGRVAVIDVDTGAYSPRTFRRASIPPRVDSHRDGDAEARARVAFERAVASHLIADVEIAAFLSGGVDSSLVVAQAQRLCGRPLRTYCVSFQGEGAADEAKHARRVAESIGSKHETLEVHPQPAQLIREALAATQQPFAVASMLPLLMLFKAASSSVKVVLTGDGGDEVGLGYPWYRWMQSTHGLPANAREGSAMERAARTVEHATSSLRPLRRAAKFARGAIAGGARASDIWRYEVAWDDAVALLSPSLRAQVVEEPSPTQIAWRADLPPVAAMRQADLDVLLRDEMLPKVDRAGMAYGVEGRVPLLDSAFVEAMIAIPVERHLAGQSKAVLRRWAQEIVPGIDAERPKHGFDVPIAAWLQGSLHDDVRRLLLEDRSGAVLDREAVRGLWSRSLAGVPGAAHAVYGALMLELWFDERLLT